MENIQETDPRHPDAELVPKLRDTSADFGAYFYPPQLRRRRDAFLAFVIGHQKERRPKELRAILRKKVHRCFASETDFLSAASPG